MRAPSFQIVISTVVILPLIVSIMAGIFQIAADLYSLGFSVCVVASFLHNFPSEAFLSAKSYKDTIKEMEWRGKIQTFFLLLAVVFLGLWIALSERLAQVLKDTNLLSVEDAAALDKPNTPIWTLVTIILDFFGKSVVAKLTFCDLLLLMVAQTELAEPTAHQRVMRQEVHVLYSIGDGAAGAKPPARAAAEESSSTAASSAGGSAVSFSSLDIGKIADGETSQPPPMAPAKAQQSSATPTGTRRRRVSPSMRRRMRRMRTPPYESGVGVVRARVYTTWPETAGVVTQQTAHS